MTQMAGKSTGGVLQIPASATQKNNSPSNAPKKAPKPPAPRLKLVVRKLPPGLTEEEFRISLGEEWRTGAGRVDWLQYKAGKVSQDPAKPSRPSRAYIHVVSSDHITPLSDKVRQASFLDAQNTANDPVLLGPPTLEFAPYAKIPGNRVRKDARQGTIDQDPDFIGFLESLTQPITKPNPVENTTDGEEKKETATTTPLVQYIKEKKANKAKEQAASKSAKQAKAEKDAKPEKVQPKKLLQRSERETPAEKPEKKSKADKAAKEAVKVASKQATSVTKPTGKASTPNASKEVPPTAPAAERKRERGNAGAASKILQRDLGISPSGGRRRGGKGASADAETTKEPAQPNPPAEPSKKEPPTKPKEGAKAKGNENTQPSEPSTPRPQPEPTLRPAQPTPPNAPPTGPANARKPAKPAKGKQTAAAPTPTATQAFLKHANPSQGVTEPLLDTAFAAFGPVAKVEIDKKKGFGYVDFVEPSGLQKAIAASPVTVAASQVVVLERKMNPGAEKARGKAQTQGQGQGQGRGGEKAGGRGPRGRGRSSKAKGNAAEKSEANS